MLNVKNKVFPHCALGGLYPICHIEVAIHISNCLTGNLVKRVTSVDDGIIENPDSSSGSQTPSGGSQAPSGSGSQAPSGGGSQNPSGSGSQNPSGGDTGESGDGGGD